jgi:hypothetical protein
MTLWSMKPFQNGETELSGLLVSCIDRKRS